MMIRKELLIGISVAALAAGTAGAQTTTDTSGNTASRTNCTGNTCTINNGVVFNSTNDSNTAAIIIRSGTGNTASITQAGDRNSSTIDITGNNNTVDHVQVGDDHRSQTVTVGNSSVSRIYQGDEGNSASVSQNALNSNGTAAAGNSGNVSNINQGTTITAAAGPGDNSSQTQGNATIGLFVAGTNNLGEDNSATVRQVGRNNLSRISQVGTTTAPADDNYALVEQGTAAFGTAFISNGNSSTVTQSSRGNSATVGMYGGGSAVAGDTATVRAAGGVQNVSNVTQTNTLFVGNTSGDNGGFSAGTPDETVVAGNPRSENVANVGISGQQHTSNVSQNGVQNTAFVSLSQGGSGNTSDPSNNVDNPAGGTNNVPANRGAGNSATVSQTGRGNAAEIAAGRDPAVSIINARARNEAGQGNMAEITQNSLTGGAADPTITRSQLSTVDANGNRVENAPTSATQGHRADAYQRGTLDRIRIEQSNNTATVFTGTGSDTTTVVQSGSFANVSQLGFNSTTTVTQTGTNTAIVSQGANQTETGGENRIDINQRDAGDFTTAGTPAQNPPGCTFGCTPAPGTGVPATSTTARNFVEVAQYGFENVTSVVQDAVNASASTWQKVGSRFNNAEIGQGIGEANAFMNFLLAGSGTGDTGANASNLTAYIEQAGTGASNAVDRDRNPVDPALAGYAGIGQDGDDLRASLIQQSTAAAGGASGNVGRIAQIESFNSANVTQNGTNLDALVVQRGTGTADRYNAVTIDQTGNNNSSTARQTANVGPSGSTAPQAGIPAGQPGSEAFPNSRAAGAASAEIHIIQRMSGNRAEVEQQGKGQYARIEQRGSNNTGGILQTAAATNAVAILEQTGDGNIMYITQTEAGQYIRVQQAGTGNSSITTTERSNTAGGTGGTANTTPITFGTTP